MNYEKEYKKRSWQGPALNKNKETLEGRRCKNLEDKSNKEESFMSTLFSFIIMLSFFMKYFPGDLFLSLQTLNHFNAFYI